MWLGAKPRNDSGSSQVWRTFRQIFALGPKQQLQFTSSFTGLFLSVTAAETLTSGSESWDTVRGLSGWEDSGSPFLKQGPCAEIGFCTFCVGKGNIHTICETHLTGLPWFPAQSIERSRQPGEALGAGIQFRHSDQPCGGAHVSIDCVGSLAGLSI